jgi:hypothetical protein
MRNGQQIDWKFVRQQGVSQHLRAWFWRLWQRLL